MSSSPILVHASKYNPNRVTCFLAIPKRHRYSVASNIDILKVGSTSTSHCLCLVLWRTGTLKQNVFEKGLFPGFWGVCFYFFFFFFIFHPNQPHSRKKYLDFYSTSFIKNAWGKKKSVRDNQEWKERYTVIYREALHRGYRIQIKPIFLIPGVYQAELKFIKWTKKSGEKKRRREIKGNKHIPTFLHKMLIMLSIRRTFLCINFLWYPGLI